MYQGGRSSPTSYLDLTLIQDGRSFQSSFQVMEGAFGQNTSFVVSPCVIDRILRNHRNNWHVMYEITVQLKFP